MTRAIMMGLYVFLVSACATAPLEPAPALQIDGLLIENKSQMWVSSARILVPVTGRFVSCTTITPQSRCSTTFPETAYTGNPVEITWNQGGQEYSTDEFVIQLPAGLDYDKPARVLVVISGPGLAGAIITQR